MNQETVSYQIPEPGAPTSVWVLNPADLEKPLDLKKVFGNDHPVEIEIGIGSGFFLSRYAQDHPDLNILGLDKETSEVMRSADKARRLEIYNLRTLRYEARMFLEEYIAPDSIENLHVYYSDPWPKKKHHRRRLWQPEFVAAAARVIKPGGKLYMKTDVHEYFVIIDQNISSNENFELLLDQRIDLEPIENDYETNFQAKARTKGHPLHYQIWQKSSPSDRSET